jgi:hypothetical protein
LQLKYHPDVAKGNKEVSAFQMLALNTLWEKFVRQGKPLPTVAQLQQESGATVGGAGAEDAVNRVVRERLGQATEGANRLLRTFNTPAAQISPRTCAAMIRQIGKYVYSASEAIRINLAPTGKGQSPMEGVYSDLTNAEDYLREAGRIMFQAGDKANQKLINTTRNYLNEFLKIAGNVMKSTGTRQSSRHRIEGLTPYYTRIRTAAETQGDAPPDIGQVSEMIRNSLTKEYDIYPPNLSTAIQDDQSILITAVNPDTGLNIQVTLRNLAGDLVYTGGGQQPATGVVPAPGGAPAMPAASRSSRRAAMNPARAICDVMEELEAEYGGDLTGGGEPQILLNTKTHEVWVSAGDWHEEDVVREIFDRLEKISGVKGVDGESESYPEGYNYGNGPSDWKKVYPTS